MKNERKSYIFGYKLDIRLLGIKGAKGETEKRKLNSPKHQNETQVLEVPFGNHVTVFRSEENSFPLLQSSTPLG